MATDVKDYEKIFSTFLDKLRKPVYTKPPVFKAQLNFCFLQLLDLFMNFNHDIRTVFAADKKLADEISPKIKSILQDFCNRINTTQTLPTSTEEEDNYNQFYELFESIKTELERKNDKIIKLEQQLLSRDKLIDECTKAYTHELQELKNKLQITQPNNETKDYTLNNYGELVPMYFSDLLESEQQRNEREIKKLVRQFEKEKKQLKEHYKNELRELKNQFLFHEEKNMAMFSLNKQTNHASDHVEEKISHGMKLVTEQQLMHYQEEMKRKSQKIKLLQDDLLKQISENRKNGIEKMQLSKQIEELKNHQQLLEQEIQQKDETIKKLKRENQKMGQQIHKLLKLLDQNDHTNSTNEKINFVSTGDNINSSSSNDLQTQIAELKKQLELKTYTISDLEFENSKLQNKITYLNRLVSETNAEWYTAMKAAVAAAEKSEKVFFQFHQLIFRNFSVLIGNYYMKKLKKIQMNVQQGYKNFYKKNYQEPFLIIHYKNIFASISQNCINRI